MDTTEDVMTAGRATPSPFRRPPSPKPTPLTGNARTQPRRPVLESTAPAAALTAAPDAAPDATTQAVPIKSVTPQQYERLRRTGARWFFWVGGLTLINALMRFTGQTMRFIIGLGTTELVTGLAARSGRGWTPAILLDVIFIGGFFLLGHLALKGHRLAYAIGIAVYGLDGLIFLLGQRWIGLGFHVFVLVMMINGLHAARKLDTRSG